MRAHGERRRQVHDVPDTMAAQGYNGPVHALITGRKKERDRRLVIEQAPQFAIVGQMQVIRLRVDDQNTGKTTTRFIVICSRSVRLAMILTGSAGRLVDSRAVPGALPRAISTVADTT